MGWNGRVVGLVGRGSPRRAAGRVGYRECARVREARLWQGVRYDSVQMQLLRGEWAALPTP